ncbi:sensor histidine kinase [Streptomyces sp. NBC_01615]|uniref:sensor histidine kinase n=1 Tax=Streptomyces sp. NBC_01615 TaxID=2975898 RepID=UPI0038657030
MSAALATRSDAIAAAGLTVRHTTSPGGAWVEGNQELVCRMVDNVMENAIVHNDEGGWIQVATGTCGPLACLTVETGGKLLDQEQVEQLIQPFRRLRADRTGSDNGAGLGLSIVAAVAEAHGGTLDLTARADGGLRVGIALPPAHRFPSAGELA